MNTRSSGEKIGNERGAGLLQVVLISALLGIVAYIFVQFMTTADQRAMRNIRRNQNLNTATEMADYVNDASVIRGSGTVINQVGSGPAVQYQ